MRRVGFALLAAAAIAALGAPVLAPHQPDEYFRALVNAPPTLPHVIDDAGGWHAPVIYPLKLVDRPEHRFEQDRSTRAPPTWVSGGRPGRSGRHVPPPPFRRGAPPHGRGAFRPP